MAASGAKVKPVLRPWASMSTKSTVTLSTRELGLCHAHVHARTDEAQPSLNLAQAVLLIAYELRLASGTGGSDGPPVADGALAGSG